MAAPHSIGVGNIISRVRAVFPDAPESYVIMLVNDALVELGMYQTKFLNAKLTITADQMWYDISDASVDSSDVEYNLKLNKLSKVDVMDSDGYYIRIPRLLDKNILLSDADSDESAIEYPG